MSEVNRSAPFLVVGESVADIVTSVAGAVDVHPGGSPANVAFGLCRLGREVTLVTALGDDAYGSLIRTHLEGAGVRVVTAGSARSTATAMAHLDETGAATYTFDIEWDLGPAALPVTPLHVHTGSIGAAMEPGAAAVADMIKSLRRVATVSFDPNVRPALLTERAAVRHRLEDLLVHTDVIKASDEDLRWLYPDVEPLNTAASWLARGPSVVVLTQGAAGSTALSRAGDVTISSTHVDVVDTVGAGDSFMAALLDGLHEQDLLGTANQDRLRDISLGTLRHVVSRASRAAAITVSRAGAMPPTRLELDHAASSGLSASAPARRPGDGGDGDVHAG
ncbi:carbohydrate kinase [uncultured Cellulomonas sp.]|uniref:carbohydrate kinase family protein n=1 Tax=uncultured Cellulomonas sp. TaxID=189682 RepID=UPI00261507F3|nr:carbohydrate kinase [uncultured Cellulomonas sp.]